MPRLFIALDVPPDVAGRLLRMLPDHRGIRPTPAAQLHLTLRFLGERDEQVTIRIGHALRQVSVPPMALQVQGVGRFRGAQGAILWAGLAESSALTMLFDAIGEALASVDIPPERRRFWPHLTMARCRPGVPERLLHDWLATHRTLTLPPWQAGRFVLFESILGRDGAQHLPLQVYDHITPDC